MFVWYSRNTKEPFRILPRGNHQTNQTRNGSTNFHKRRASSHIDVTLDSFVPCSSRPQVGSLPGAPPGAVGTAPWRLRWPPRCGAATSNVPTTVKAATTPMLWCGRSRSPRWHQKIFYHRGWTKIGPKKPCHAKLQVQSVAAVFCRLVLLQIMLSICIRLKFKDTEVGSVFQVEIVADRSLDLHQFVCDRLVTNTYTEYCHQFGGDMTHLTRHSLVSVESYVSPRSFPSCWYAALLVLIELRN